MEPDLFSLLERDPATIQEGGEPQRPTTGERRKSRVTQAKDAGEGANAEIDVPRRGATCNT
jgi:hypothetical protein